MRVPTSGLQLTVPIPRPLNQHAEHTDLAGGPARLPQTSCKAMMMKKSMTDILCYTYADLEPAQAIAAGALAPRCSCWMQFGRCWRQWGRRWGQWV